MIPYPLWHFSDFRFPSIIRFPPLQKLKSFERWDGARGKGGKLFQKVPSLPPPNIFLSHQPTRVQEKIICQMLPIWALRMGQSESSLSFFRRSMVCCSLSWLNTSTGMP